MSRSPTFNSWVLLPSSSQPNMKRYILQLWKTSFTLPIIHTLELRSCRWSSTSFLICNLKSNRRRPTASWSATPRLRKRIHRPSSCRNICSSWPSSTLRWTSTSQVCLPPQQFMSRSECSSPIQIDAAQVKLVSGRAILSKILATKTTTSKHALKTTSNLPR